MTSKLDFGEEEASVVTNSSKEDNDVEVKHTIVVSTKLRNNNRKGIHNNGEFSLDEDIFKEMNINLRSFQMTRAVFCTR